MAYPIYSVVFNDFALALRLWLNHKCRRDNEERYHDVEARSGGSSPGLEWYGVHAVGIERASRTGTQMIVAMCVSKRRGGLR